MRNRLKNYDFLLIIVPLLLAAFGIVMIYSASMVTAVVSGLDSTYYVVKQAQWFGLGLVVFILCLLIPYQSYQKLVIPLIILSVISLLIVPFFGKTEYNATRTIVLLGFNIQPSESFLKTSISFLISTNF